MSCDVLLYRFLQLTFSVFPVDVFVLLCCRDRDIVIVQFPSCCPDLEISKTTSKTTYTGEFAAMDPARSAAYDVCCHAMSKAARGVGAKQPNLCACCEPLSLAL